MSPSQYQCPSGTIFQPTETWDSGGTCITPGTLASVVATTASSSPNMIVVVVVIGIAFLLFRKGGR